MMEAPVSKTRKVVVNLDLQISDAATLDVVLPPILPRPRMVEILRRHLAADGWEPGPERLVRQQEQCEESFDPATGEVCVELTEHVQQEVHARIDLDGPPGGASKMKKDLEQTCRREVMEKVERRLEQTRRQFREDYVPKTLAEALAEKAQSLDPAARISRHEDGGQLVVTVELEV